MANNAIVRRIDNNHDSSLGWDNLARGPIERNR